MLGDEAQSGSFCEGGESAYLDAEAGGKDDAAGAREEMAEMLLTGGAEDEKGELSAPERTVDGLRLTLHLDIACL